MKTVHFIRHCQSTWNEAQYVRHLSHKDQELQTEAFLDAPLTSLGEKQVMNLRPQVKALNADIAITSPYKRAIDTCLGTYGSQQVLVTHWCGERGSSLCDIGNTKESLTELYPMLDFSDLPANIWWFVAENLKDQLTDQKKCFEWLLNNGTYKMGETDDNFVHRMQNFYAYLQNRSERSIVVFSHSLFLRSFLNKYFDRCTRHIPNGEIITYLL